MNELIRMAFEDTADPLWMAPGTRRFAQEYSGPVGAAQDVPYGGWPVQADALDYSGMAPGIGDVTGPMADARMYMRDPEQLTPGNALMSLAGLLPIVPGVTKRLFHGGSLDKNPHGILWGSESPDLANEYADMRFVRGGTGAIYPYEATYDVTFDADKVPKSTSIGGFVSEMAKQAEAASVPFDKEAVKQHLATLRRAARVEESGPSYDRMDFWYEPQSMFGEEGHNALSALYDLFGFDSIKNTERGSETIGLLDPKNTRSIFGGDVFK